ncbi:MAG: cobalt ABC transporter permease [Coriobacteriia bacterium]
MSDTATNRKPLLSARELALLALVAALVVVSKSLLRIPLRIPGHSGAIWIAFYIVGKGLVKRPYAGTMLGLTAGLLATVFVGGHEGLLLWLKYLAPGVVLDLIGPFVRNRFDDPVIAIVAGALAHCAKLVTSLLVTLAMGLPAGFITAGLGVSAVTHTLFGAIGGWLGSFILIRLGRTGLPYFSKIGGGQTTAEERPV